MVFTHGVSHDTRRFPVGLIVIQMELAHVVKHASLHRALSRPWHRGWPWQ